jgi:hypothetical protein
VTRSHWTIRIIRQWIRLVEHSFQLDCGAAPSMGNTDSCHDMTSCHGNHEWTVVLPVMSCVSCGNGALCRDPIGNIKEPIGVFPLADLKDSRLVDNNEMRSHWTIGTKRLTDCGDCARIVFAMARQVVSTNGLQSTVTVTRSQSVRFP